MAHGANWTGGLGNPGMFGNIGDPSNQLSLNFSDMGFSQNPLVIMALQQVLGGTPGHPGVFGQQGMIPGQFFPTKNLYDQFKSRDYWNNRRALMADAAQSDRQTYVSMMQGVARMSGTPWGLSQARAANTLSGDMAYMAPMLAQMAPETFDAMHGSRGSATVLSMHMHRAGQFAVDPVTGRTGLSSESAGQMSRNVRDQFFGPGYNPADWRGMSAGQSGLLYEELMHRGMMGRSIGTQNRATQVDLMARDQGDREDLLLSEAKNNPARFRAARQRFETARGMPGGSMGSLGLDEQIRKMSESEGVATDALRNLQQFDPGAFETRLRQFDARRTASRLQNLSGAVSAMRDIFGDMGRPNAPMSEIVEGLNQLTQGGMSQMSARQLEQSVRTTYAIAKQTGMGIDAFQGLAAQGAEVARVMGLNPAFATQATQGAATFGAAFAQAGGGDRPAWGNADREKLTIMDQQLRLRAARSPAADRLAATVRYMEMIDQDVQGPARALAEAVQQGRQTFTDPTTGQQRSVYMQERDWRQLMERSGVRAGVANELLGDDQTNQEFVHRYRIQDTIRDTAQRQDVQRFVGQEYRRGARTGLAAAGFGTDDARRIEGRMGKAIAGELMNMSAEDRADPASMNQLLIQRIKDKPEAFGLTKADLARLNDDQLRSIVELGRGNMSEAIPKGQFAGYGTYQALFQAHDPATARRRQAVEAQATATAAIQTQMAGLGRAGPIERLMDMLQNPPANWGEAVAEAFGGVADPSAVRGSLRSGPITAERIQAIESKKRMALVTEEYMKSAQEMEQIASDPNLSQEEKAKKTQALQRRMSALDTGGKSAMSELHDELKANDLSMIDLQRLPALVKSGKVTQTQADRLLALRVAGVDKGGLRNLSEAEGIEVDAKIGRRDIDDTVLQSQSLSRQRDRMGSAKTDAEKTSARGEAIRHANNLLGGGAQRIDVMLGDDATMRSLGKGGLDVTLGVKDAQREMRMLLHDTGKSLEELLVTGDPSDPAVRRARELQAKMESGFADIADRMGRGADTKGKMTAEEQKQLKEVQDKEKMGDADRARQLVDEFVNQAGEGGRVSDKQRQRMAAALGGTGVEGRDTRERFERAAKARGTVEKLAKAQGFASVQAFKEHWEGKGWAEGLVGASEETSRMRGLLQEADTLTRFGKMGEGTGDEAIDQAMEGFKPGARKPVAAAAGGAADDTGKGGQIVLTGTLDLKSGAISATGNGRGTTPVARA